MTQDTNINLREIYRLMEQHDRVHAPGSESMQWQAFQESLAESMIKVNYDFAAFWTAVASHDWDKAEKHGFVPDCWKEEDVSEVK